MNRDEALIQAVQRSEAQALELSELKLVLQTSEDNARRLRSLAAISADWYWEQDAQGQLIKSSGPVAEMLGLGATEQSGWNEEERAQLNAKIASRAPFLDFIYTRTRAGGSVQYLQVSGEPMFDSASRFAGYRGIGMDITERMQWRPAPRATP